MLHPKNIESKTPGKYPYSAVTPYNIIDSCSQSKLHHG